MISETAPKENKIVKGKISTKYQIVIPKEVRGVVRDANPGTSVYITAIDSNNIKIEIKGEKWATRARGIVREGLYN